MALITDKFHKVSSGTRAQPTTLTAQKALAASSISTAALNGWATDTPVDFQLYLPDSNNLDNFGNPKPIPGSQSEWVGIVSGSTITQLELTGGSDTIYPIGTIVVALPTANWADSLVEGILTHANPNGSLLPAAITSATADASITSAKIASESWTSYTPTFIGLTVGNSTILAKYIKFGKLVTVKIRFTLGTTYNFTGNLGFSLPVLANYDIPQLALAAFYIEDLGIAGYALQARLLSNNSVTLSTLGASGTYVTTLGADGNTPFTWGPGDYFTGTFTYESA